MMGIKDRGLSPLVQVTLEELVSADGFYRYLDSKLELGFVLGAHHPRRGAVVAGDG